eukprot:5859746-Pyramimonas_sp.AAC.2
MFVEHAMAFEGNFCSDESRDLRISWPADWSELFMKLLEKRAKLTGEVKAAFASFLQLTVDAKERSTRGTDGVGKEGSIEGESKTESKLPTLKEIFSFVHPDLAEEAAA